MMKQDKKYTVIDLFAGCGGLSLGLYQAGWDGLFAIEKNANAFETLNYNLIKGKKHFAWPKWLPQSCLDIIEVNENYSEQLIQLRGKVDLVAGGPPCQGFSMAGKKVLCIDLDPQGNLGFCLGLDTEGGSTILDVLKGDVSIQKAISRTEGIDILPSDITLSSSGLEYNPGEEKESILKNVLKPVMDFYDYIVIDTPPALNLLTVNAYAVSDYLIIPMASDILSLVGLSQLKETVESVRIQINPGLKIMGILLNRFNPRTCLCRDVLEMAGQLAAQLETRVFDTKIRSGVAIAEAPAHGESIFEYSPRASAVKDYVKFLDEVEKIIGFREK